ncbi:lantibiotic dehydratase [Streptomyces buecherae]|uniref:lantibiotic dehydratase n=1 Tax=Streptomyces buecherae TaxID=2763006 RepID=UPI00368D748A
MTGAWRMSPVFVLRHAGMPWEWLADVAFPAELVRLADRAEDDGADATARFDDTYAFERTRLRGELHRRARHEEFRAAVFLSNPGMYEGMLRGYLDRDEIPDNARFRRVERQIYLYLQRFCGKNETTSTFGPMGYGERDDGEGLRVERRAQRRRVLPARWALEELARALARDPALRRHIPVRRPLLTASADPGRTPHPPQERDLWDALADGPLSLAALAARLGTSVAETGRRLRPLLADGRLHRGLLFPADVVDGLPGLRGAVAALPDVPGRDAWLAELDAFAEGLRAFAAAGVDERARLLAALEARFTELTGVPARRGAGDIYADRLILFEEASSPFHLRIGDDLARTVERQVADGLDLSAAAGTAVQRDYKEQMAAVLRKLGGSARFTEYASAAKPQEEMSSSFGGHRHTTTVDVPPGDDVTLPAPAELAAPQRYALPDICLTSPFGPRPGVLLARVHHHLLLEGWLTTFWDDTDRITRQVRTWLTGAAPGRRLAALATTRRNKGFYRFPGRRVLIAHVDHEGGTDTVAGDQLTVRLRDGAPRLADRDGHRVLLYPMLADLTTYPPIAALTDDPVLHLPVRQADPRRALGRVRVGGAVYQRARWELELAELRGLRGSAAFRWLRRTVGRDGLPRFFFVRAESERKPLLIDSWSPFAVDVLCHLARDVDRCRAEEMYPAPEDLWLRDERGHYTCELRVQFLRAVDGHVDDAGDHDGDTDGHIDSAGERTAP